MSAEPYKTLRFGPGEIPAGLLREHRLKPDVSGRIHVREGRLVFVDHEGQRTQLAQGESHAILPDTPHHLEEAETASVEIQFFREGA